MKKFLLSSAVIIIFTVYALHVNLGSEETGVVAIRTTPPNSFNIAPTDTPTASLGPMPVPTRVPVITPRAVPVATPQGRYKNGSYTGSVADAFYGNVQVQVTISGGQISDVAFLQYPNDRRTSQMINSQAMPMLKQEAIQAQSAQVSGVSGATATSGAFIESLTSALQQAG
jgi:uncharacterized protein with FMN-binding domain